MVRDPNRCEKETVSRKDSAARRTGSGKEDRGKCWCTFEPLFEGQWAIPNHCHHRRKTDEKNHPREEERKQEVEIMTREGEKTHRVGGRMMQEAPQGTTQRMMTTWETTQAG